MKIAIIGTVPATRIKAPFNDPSWECWLMGPAWADEGNPMRWDRWFELHPVSEIEFPETESQKAQNPGYLDWMIAQDRPIYMKGPLDRRIKSAVLFPWHEISNRYDTYFLDSTVAWMLAFILYRMDLNPVEEVGIWGIDFATEPERVAQKKGTYHFLALLREAGVKITIPPESDMAYQPAPYPGASRLAAKQSVRLAEQEARLTDMQANLIQLEKYVTDQRIEIARVEGALSALKWMGSVV